MFRIDNTSAAAALPTPGVAGPNPDGFFSEGDPVGGVQATVVSADWLNAVQEELCDVIESAGLSLGKTDRTQLRQAIQRMIVGGDFKTSVRAATTANITLSGAQTIDGVSVVAGDRVLVKDQSTGADNGIYVAAAGAWSRATDADTSGELSAGTCIPVEEGTLNADTIWMLTNNGTVTIGTTALTFDIKTGAASTTRKGLVQLATTAEAQALTNALNAITPSTLADAFKGSNQSLGSAGYQKLPGALILQWGYASATVGGNPVTFPIAFPSVCLYAGPGIASTSSIPACVSSTTTGFNFYANTGSSSHFWLAIGK